MTKVFFSLASLILISPHAQELRSAERRSTERELGITTFLRWENNLKEGQGMSQERRRVACVHASETLVVKRGERLVVHRGESLVVKPRARLLIQSGASLLVESGGLLDINPGGVLNDVILAMYWPTKRLQIGCDRGRSRGR